VANEYTISQSWTDRFKDYFNTHASLIVMIWFVIFIARFIRLTANLAYVQRLKHYKTYAPPAAWKDKVNELVLTLGIKKQIQLLESGVVKVPVVMGVLKPVILLPLGLLAHLPADEIEAILLHELAHIKRRDYFMNLLQSFAETIFFFNPALMWLSSMIREERENCCDDIAISITNSKTKFINALIAFQEYNFSTPSYTVGFPGKKNQLLNRVKRIISDRNKTLNATEKSLLTFGMGVFILFSFAAAKKITPVVTESSSSTESYKRKNERAETKTNVSIDYRHLRKPVTAKEAIVSILKDHLIFL
jgi:bla regulator protein BlaR1